MRMAPRTFFTSSATIRMSPSSANAVVGFYVAEADQRVGIAHDKACVLKADEGDEQTDAAGHRRVELMRNGTQDHLPDTGCGEGQEDHAGKKHGAQRRLPWDVHLDADRVGEVGVQAHARGESDGIAGHNAHQDRAERSRQAGGRGGRRQGHARIRQNGRIDQHDVRHGEEGRDSRQDLGAPVGVEGAKLEVRLNPLDHGWP